MLGFTFQPDIADKMRLFPLRRASKSLKPIRRLCALRIHFKRFRQLLGCLILFLTPFAASSAEPNFDAASSLYHKKNYLEAFRAFSVLAENGDPRAQTIVALMHRFGEGTEQDHGKAFQWYAAAAQQGYPPAQYHTGSMLADGLGTEQDTKQAIIWLNKSLENGFDRAHEKLASLNAAASPLGKTNQQTAWSKDWDLHLPADMRLDEAQALEPNRSYLVQVGAMRTHDAANRLWKILNDNHPNLFQHRQPIIQSVNSNGRGVYQIRTGPFEDFRAATQFCERLLASTVQAGCLPIEQP